MDFALTQDFPASLERLWATLGRVDYVRSKYRALGSSAVRLRHFTATSKLIDIELERDVPVHSSELPAWSRALVGRTQALRHRTVWRRQCPTRATATLDITLTGLPLHTQGLATMVEIGPELTRMRLTWRIVSPLPVVGRMVERLLVSQVRAALEADHAFTLQFLADAHARRPKVRSRSTSRAASCTGDRGDL